MSRSTRKWRLNTRAAIILGVLLGVGLPTAVVLSYYRGLGSTRALLRQAELQAEADPPDYNLALSYLNEYLKTIPAGDPRAFEALDRKSEILEKVGNSATDFQEAVRACQLAMVLARNPASQIDPTGEKAQEIRRRLIRATIQLTPFLGVNTPLSAAVDVARELADADGDGQIDAEASPADLRLLARTLEFQAERGDDADARQEAIALLERAAEADPTDLAGAEQLASIYQFRLEADNPEERRQNAANAERVLDALLSQNRAAAEAAEPGSEAHPQAQQRLAGAHLVRFRHWATRASREPGQSERNRLAARADAELSRAMEVLPDDANVLLTAVEYAVQAGDNAKARAYFDRIPAEARAGLRGQLALGLIDLGRDQPDAAIESFRRGLEVSGGSDADLTWQLAYILTDLGRLSEAEPLIRQHRRLIGGDEPNPRHRLLQGLYDIASGDPDKALDQLRAARFQVDPKNDQFVAQIFQALARAHTMKGEINDALEMYREASRARPRWSTPYLRRSALLHQTGRLDDAVVELDSGLIDLPDDADLLIAKARLLMIQQQTLAPDRRDWADVQKLLDAARKVAPRSVGLIRSDADLKLLQGDPNAAAALLAEAVRHDPRSAELWVTWAGVLTRMNQAAQALIVLEQGSAPAAAGDRAALRVARARILAATGRGQQARDLLIRNLEALSQDDQALIYAELGNQLRARGQLDEALDAYQNWAKLQPSDPKPLVAQIELANLLGDREAAQQRIEALKALGGTGQVYADVARVQELLRENADGTPEAALQEADTLITRLEGNANSERAAALLRGLYHEHRDHPDEAIDAYERALTLGGGGAANRLAVLYTRTGRLDALEALRARMATIDLAAETAGITTGNADFDRVSTVALLREGRTAEAEALARQVAAGDPDSLDARLWEARVLNSAGKPEEAEATLRELAETSTAPGPWLALLFFQVSRGETDDARATIDQIKEKVQTETPELLLGQCYRVLGDNEAAEQALRAAHTQSPDNPAAARALASFYEATRQPEKAIALLRTVLDADSSARWAARTLGLLLAQQPGGDWEEAWKLVELPDGAEDRPEERLARALVLLRSPESDRQDQAVALFESLVADLPSGTPIVQAARDALARVYAARGQNEKLAALTAVGAANPSNPQAIALHAEVLLREGKRAEARAQLQRLESAAPGQIVTDKLRALVLQAEGDPKAATESLLKAFETHRADADGGRAAGREFLDLLGVRGFDAMIRPASVTGPEDLTEQLARQVAEAFPADAWLLGQILDRQQRPDAALEACLTAVKAVGADLRDAREAAALAINLAVPPGVSEGLRQQAEAVVEAARARHPQSPELMILEGYLRHAQGRYAEEVVLYRQARDLNPPSSLYLNNMAWALALELGEPTEALDLIDGLLALLASDRRYAGARIQCLDTRGMVLLALGRTDEAIADLNTALEADPRNAVYLFHLARAHAQAGRDAEARAFLTRAQDAGLDPDQLEPSERAALDQLRQR